MPLADYQWLDVKRDYIQVKFTNNIDTTTLVVGNFGVRQLDIATPALVAAPFKAIDVNADYSPISRMLTLWWNVDLVDGNYSLEIANLQNFLGQPLSDFSIDFTWYADNPATPNDVASVLPPTRIPIEVEDYSIKTPGWTAVEPVVATIGSGALKVLEVIPASDVRYNLSVHENLGKIDITFSDPIYSNFMTPYYFSVARKTVKRGIANWEDVPISIVGSLDSKIVSLYMPATDVDGFTVYSYGKRGTLTTDEDQPIVDGYGYPIFVENPPYNRVMTVEEFESLIFFNSQTKYRLVISPLVGS